MDAVMAEAADPDALVQLGFGVAFPKTGATMQFFRNQMMECQLERSPTQWTFARLSSCQGFS